MVSSLMVQCLSHARENLSFMTMLHSMEVPLPCMVDFSILFFYHVYIKDTLSLPDCLQCMGRIDLEKIM